MLRHSHSTSIRLLLGGAALGSLLCAASPGAGSLAGARPAPARQPTDEGDELLAHLRANAMVQENALRATESLYNAGRASEADLLRARIAKADAERLIGEVTGDPAPLRAPDELRVQLYERLIADAALRPGEADPAEVAGWHHSLAEARVRLWRLGNAG